jgi:hypothetical protein
VTARDRTVLMIVGIVIAVGGFWMLALKPKQDDIKALDGKIGAARQRLETATSAAAAAQQAKARYESDYATVARLGKAVPVDDDTPSLVYQLERAAGRAKVDFRSIQLAASGGTQAATNSTPAAQTAAAGAAEKETDKGASSGATEAPATPAPATQTAAAALPPGATVGPAGFPTMPFDFAFSGRFFRLESFLSELDKFTRVSEKGAITVRGRLLTVDGIALTADPQDFPKMTAQIHATAYLLPQDQSLTDGATPAGPATPAATAAGTTTAASSPTPAAVVGAGR